MAEQKVELDVNGKKVTYWFDYEAYKAEQEWLKQKEIEYWKNQGFGWLLQFCSDAQNLGKK